MLTLGEATLFTSVVLTSVIFINREKSYKVHDNMMYPDQSVF